MKVYLWVFVNFKPNNWAKLISIAKFAYNNAKNTSIGCMPFKLNCEYYSWIFYKENVNFCSKFKSVDKLLAEL